MTHLGEDRGNGPTTRSARRAGIHALFRYAAHACDLTMLITLRVLAIAPKRGVPRRRVEQRCEAKVALLGTDIEHSNGERNVDHRATVADHGALGVSDHAAREEDQVRCLGSHARADVKPSSNEPTRSTP